MKRILFLVNHDIVIYNFRLELVEKLLEQGYDVIISSPYGPRIDKLIKLGCKYEEVKISRHSKNIFKDIKLIIYYKKLLKKIKPDIVLTFTIKPNIYGGIACARLKIPYVANITGLGIALEKKGLFQFFLVLLYKYAFRKINTIFIQNDKNRQFFVDKKILPNKLKLLPGSGVNLERFNIIEYPPSNVVEFAFISRIMKEKGIDEYLKAAKYIKSKYPNIVFHVCGFCEQSYKNLLQVFQKNGIIKYHGLVDDIQIVLKNVCCVIHPSYYPEGISNILLESAACARPIITTNNTGCREVIDDGVNGYIAEQQNHRDLIDKIEKFLSLSYETKKQMGLAGRLKVEIEFDRNIVVKAYIDIINSL